MPVPVNFHGKKGRSGRKCVRDEQLRIRVIEKAWLKKEDKMTDQDATQIVLKDMTGKESVMLNLPKPIDELLQNNSLSKNKADTEKDSRDTRGDVGLENGLDNDLSDSSGAK